MISRRFGRDEPGPDRGADGPADGELEAGDGFALEKAHERRILSWSPDPDEEFEPEQEEVEPPPAPVVEAPRPAPVVREPAAVPLPQAVVPETAPPQIEQIVREAAPDPVAPVRAEPAAPPTAPSGDEPRRRGRPRGRPRRQVHFHVDPDEELLLLEAARKHGSQQKGLVAALQALQDNEVLRDEIERLRVECERQRVLLADAEALFNR